MEKEKEISIGIIENGIIVNATYFDEQWYFETMEEAKAKVEELIKQYFEELELDWIDVRKRKK